MLFWVYVLYYILIHVVKNGNFNITNRNSNFGVECGDAYTFGTNPKMFYLLINNDCGSLLVVL